MMACRALFTLPSAVVMLTLGTVAVAGGTDKNSGTWTMNPAKSTFSPGPAMRSLTETIESDEHSFNVDANGTDADGNAIHIAFDPKFDGQDYPTNGVPWADAVSVKRIGARTVQLTQKKKGHVTMVITCKVSADGKTRPCTLKGADLQGHMVNNLVFFDRK